MTGSTCVICGRPAVYRFEGQEPMCLDCPEPRPRTDIPEPPVASGPDVCTCVLCREAKAAHSVP